MSKSYGQCVGCADAIKWVESLTGVDEIMQERVLNRMRYEFDKDIPVPVKFRKGIYGRKYDNYSCGNCGYGGLEVHEHYCPDCGFRIDWRTKSDNEEPVRSAEEGETAFGLGEGVEA